MTAVLTAQYTIETPWTEASVKRKGMPGGTVWGVSFDLGLDLGQFVPP